MLLIFYTKLVILCLNYFSEFFTIIKPSSFGSSHNNGVPLKVASTTILLVCLLCLKDSTCEIRKNVFNFTSKALLVLEIIKF